MGQFKAGVWGVGLLFYFFALYFIILSNVNVSQEFDLQTTAYADDPGFQSKEDTMTTEAYCSGSLPLSAAFCSNLRISSNESCSYVPGCYWNELYDDCAGIPSLVDYGGSCSPQMNETLCRLLGCSWLGYSSQGYMSLSSTDDVDMSAVTTAFGIMTGFSADIGIPSAWKWVFSFIFFWIPFVAFIWCLYMMLPFVH